MQKNSCEYCAKCWRYAYTLCCNDKKYAMEDTPDRYDLLIDGYLDGLDDIFPKGGLFCVSLPYWSGHLINGCPALNSKRPEVFCTEYKNQKEAESRRPQIKKPKNTRDYIPGKVVKAVYRKFRFKCAYCGIGFYCKRNGKKVNFHVDHRVPLVQGGTSEFVNLVLSCEQCNLLKGNEIWKVGCRCSAHRSS